MPRPAKFPGNCSCGASVTAGALIEYDRAARKISKCPSCLPSISEDGAATASMRYRVLVQTIKFRSDDGTFTIAKTVFDDPDTVDFDKTPFHATVAFGGAVQRPFSCVGRLGRANPGDTLDVIGQWAQGKFGWDLKVDTAVPVVGHTDQAIRAYLARFSQVGTRRAQELLRKNGGRVRLIAKLDAGDASALTCVDGITDDRAKQILEEYTGDVELRSALMWLSELGLPSKMVADILEHFGSRTVPVLKDDPYRMVDVRSIGFVRADQVAREGFGIAADDPRRAAAAVLHILQEAERDGHTWVDYNLLTVAPERHAALEL